MLRFVILPIILCSATRMVVTAAAASIDGLTSRRQATAAFCASTPSTTTPIPPPPPPSISVPVWSLACPIEEESDAATSASPATASMNIVTFATAVSVAPPKLWAVSLYHDTLTKDSFLKSGTGVLQLLAPSQKMLIPALGKRSGYEAGYSKPDACADLGFAWVTCRRRNLGLSSAAADHSYDRMELLPACSSYIFLKLVSTVEAGDHLVALCQVTGTGVWDEGGQTVLPVQENALPRCLDPSSALYTGQLRQDDIL